MEGWIKSHRAILDNPIVCKDADHYAVWGYLLHNAAHTPTDAMFNGKRMTLKPGQLIAGRKRIAEFFKIKESKVQRILMLFENERQIERQTTNTNSLISITNWVLYQSDEQQNELRMNSDRTASEQQVNGQRTTTEQPMNSDRTASEQQVNTIQECNNVINNTHTVITSNNITSIYPNARTHVTRVTRAVEILDWIAANYPAVQQMAEPVTEQQAEWLAAKYTDDDIHRIVMAMDNKGATKNKSAFSTFAAFARQDTILKERKEAAEGKRYTYSEVCDLVFTGRYVAADFAPVAATADGKRLFARRQDVTSNA